MMMLSQRLKIADSVLPYASAFICLSACATVGAQSLQMDGRRIGFGHTVPLFPPCFYFPNIYCDTPAIISHDLRGSASSMLSKL